VYTIGRPIGPAIHPLNESFLRIGSNLNVSLKDNPNVRHRARMVASLTTIELDEAGSRPARKSNGNPTVFYDGVRRDDVAVNDQIYLLASLPRSAS
jgi:hypothetical protein